MSNLKVLVLSNSAISETESNGRVLKSLLPLDSFQNVLNLFVSGEPIKMEQISYCKISDKKVLQSVISLGIVNPEDKVIFENKINKDVSISTVSKKTAYHYFIRNVVWKLSFRTKNLCLKKALDFSPDLVFIMGANLPFFYEIGLKIAKKTGCKLVVYSAEDYPLKEYDYMSGKLNHTFFSRIVQRSLRKTAKKTFNNSDLCIFNSSQLRDFYVQKGFANKVNTHILHLPSSLIKENGEPAARTILYAGNLSDDRCNSLLEFADALSAINSDYYLLVYGRVSCCNYLEKIKRHKKIKYCGIVNFETLKDIFKQVEFLLHVEGFKPYTLLDYKHAFSTKIADYLILGKPFICYGSKEIAGVSFLSKLNDNFTITSKVELEEKLFKILNNRLPYKYNEAMIWKEFSEFEVRKTLNHLLLKIVDKK